MIRYVGAILFHSGAVSSIPKVPNIVRAPLMSVSGLYLLLDSDIVDSTGPVRLVVDTASFISWVPSNTCSTCGGHAILNDAGAGAPSFAVAYGSGNVSGGMVNAAISVSERISPPISMILGSATHVDIPWYPSADFDGLLALGYPGDDSPNAPNFVDQLHMDGLIPCRAFSLEMKSELDITLSFGSLSASDCVDSRIIWSPVVDKPYWSVGMNSVSFGETVSITKNAMIAIVDSGSSVISVPNGYWDELFAFVLPHSTVACNSTDLLPSLQFHLDSNQTVIVSPRDYLIPSSDGTGCTVAIIVSGARPESALADKWILGLPFLRSRVSIFDMDNDRVGICEMSMKFTGKDRPHTYMTHSIALSFLIAATIL